MPSENIPDMTKNVCFLGMGIMGSAMAANLARKNLKVKVWNRSSTRPGLEVAEQAGAIVCQKLSDALAGADLVFSCLGDVADVESVLTGPAGVSQRAGAGAIVVDFSTIGPAAARDIEAKLAAAQMIFLDAPVTGGDVGAREGTLTIMVGGDEAIFHQVEPYLQQMGKTVRYCGPTGSGQAIKLANQALCALNLMGVCEAMRMVEDLGLDKKLVVDVLEKGAGGSWALSNLGPRIVAGDLQPAFAMKHMLKDLRLVFENVPAQGQFPGTRLAFDLFEKVLAMDAGAGDLGTQAMIKAYRRQADGAGCAKHDGHEVQDALEGMECADRIALEWQLDGE